MKNTSVGHEAFGIRDLNTYFEQGFWFGLFYFVFVI